MIQKKREHCCQSRLIDPFLFTVVLVHGLLTSPLHERKKEKWVKVRLAQRGTIFLKMHGKDQTRPGAKAPSHHRTKAIKKKKGPHL